MRTRKTTRTHGECIHPSRHLHPCYDDRWETCDLCQMVRPREIIAPWIIEYDDTQPPPPMPPQSLFSSLEQREQLETPVEMEPEPAPQLVTVPSAAQLAPDGKADMETCPRCAGKRRVTDQPVFPNNAPAVKRTCPRCHGAGKIAAYHLGSGSGKVGVA